MAIRQGLDSMSTRTFTLEAIDKAADHVGFDVAAYDRFKGALLAAKPEAKTCEDCGGRGLVPCGCLEGRNCRYAGLVNCDACYPLNPAPAASQPAWLPPAESPSRADNNALVRDVARLLNGRSRENVSNTPDWILAEAMVEALIDFEDATGKRERWYGRNVDSAATPDRAKAVPRDAAKDSVPGALRPSVDEKPNPVPTERVTEEPRAGLAKGAVSESVGTGGGQPGVPEGWKLGKGWEAYPAEERLICWHGRDVTKSPCDGATCLAVGRFYKRGGQASCFEHAKEDKAIVPAEPRRPVTGEAESESYIPSFEEDPDWCICRLGEQCVHHFGPKLAISSEGTASIVVPPAPGNHPGTAAHDPRCCAKCHHAAHVNPCQHGCACTLSSPSGTTYVAPGKSDEAPLVREDEHTNECDWHRSPPGRCDCGAHARADKRATGERIAALEERLAEAERAGKEAWYGREDLRAQLATRDSRIAGLEASSAELVKRCQEAEGRLDAARGNTVAEVMLERERCAQEAREWWQQQPGRPFADLVNRIRRGAPAPTGKL